MRCVTFALGLVMIPLAAPVTPQFLFSDSIDE